MKKIYIGLLLLALMGVSCHNDSKECRVPCPLMNTAIYMIMKVRIADKATGNDLFLSPTSPYKPSDLKVTSSADANFQVRLDSLAVSAGFVTLPDFQSTTYTLQLANLSADHIKVVTGVNSKQCCATTEVQSITLNDSLICAPCSAQQDVLIKK